MEKDESIFESVFGKGGPFEAIFGKGGAFEKMLGKDGVKVVRHVHDGKKCAERARYQEALITELLIELAGKKLMTNEEAREVIKRAKERANAKTDEAAKK